LHRVVKATVFLKDMNDFGAMNEVYAKYFTLSPPARSTVAGGAFAEGCAGGNRSDREFVGAARATSGVRIVALESTKRNRTSAHRRGSASADSAFLVQWIVSESPVIWQ